MKIFKIRTIISFLLFLSLFFIPERISAQVTDNWSEAVNISSSGSSSSPSFVITPEGIIHVYWLDDFDDLMYAQFDGENWSAPVKVSAPNELYIPRLVLGENNQIHAFWLDADGNLFYNRATGNNLSNPGIWSGSVLLSNGIAEFDALVASDGSIHLTFIQSTDDENRPAGVYYQKSTTAGASWQSPVLIYASRYLRSLEAGSANVQIAATSNEAATQLFLAWDNRLLKTVYFARSLDGGENWEAPIEIASQKTRASATTPYNIQIGISGNQIILVYQDGQPGFSCAQSFQFSEDAGTSWSTPKRMMEDVPGCATSNQLLEFNQYLLLTTVNRDQVSLTAWDGLRWSKSQQQSEMLQVIDPSTRSILTLNQQQVLVDNDGYLNLIGSDLEQRDIWWRQRSLGDIGSWFEQDNSWSSFETITFSETPFSSISLTADAQQQLHLFWSKGSEGISDLPGNTIFYSRWEDKRLWVAPVPIQRAINEFTDQISAGYDARSDSLLLVWKDGFKGEIYFSSSPANQAIIPASWGTAVKISSTDHRADSPFLITDSTGKIIVIYAVPVNENRGIYLSESNDGGVSWSQPIGLVNGSEIEPAVISYPQLVVSNSNQYHLLWRSSQISSDNLYPTGLYYRHSPDGGKTWSSPEVVSQNPVIWSQILESSNGTLHRFWLAINGNQKEIWHQISTNGADWQTESLSPLLGELIGSPSITSDSSGRIHLVQMLLANDVYSLQQQTWENNWLTKPSKEIEFEPIVHFTSPILVMSPTGFLGTVFSLGITTTENLIEYQLIFASQQLEDLPMLETPQPIIEANENEANAGEINTPTQPATIPTSQPTQFINPAPSLTINPTIGILIGVFFSIILIVGVTVYRMWQKQSS